MPGETDKQAQDIAEVRARLHEVAQMLRTSGSLDPESRPILAELMDELGATLNAAHAAPAEVARLAESAAHLAESLHHQHDQGFLGNARDRLNAALIQAEVKAPLAAGVARRLLDAIANLGI
jgi:hypothetical protein